MGHLRGYVREVDRGAESGPPGDRIAVDAAALSESRPSINYMLEGPSNDQYHEAPTKEALESGHS